MLKRSCKRCRAASMFFPTTICGSEKSRPSASSRLEMLCRASSKACVKESVWRSYHRNRGTEVDKETLSAPPPIFFPMMKPAHANQSICVFVNRSLPRTVRIGKIDIGLQAASQFLVFCHLYILVVNQGFPDVWGNMYELGIKRFPVQIRRNCRTA